jgi:hypothetical protein
MHAWTRTLRHKGHLSFPEPVAKGFLHIEQFFFSSSASPDFLPWSRQSRHFVLHATQASIGRHGSLLCDQSYLTPEAEMNSLPQDSHRTLKSRHTTQSVLCEAEP